MKIEFRKFLMAAFCCIALAAGAQERLFPYPEPPEEMTTLGERTNFLVSRFWERCNVTTAIADRQAFKGAFSDYVSFMPYADATVVHESIDNLIDRFKKNPDKLLTLAQIARELTYDADGEVISDEIFLPFAQAVASNKKIKGPEKAEMARIAHILSQSQVGMKAPEIEFTRPDGTKGHLSELVGAYVLVYFDDPDCSDCFLTRVRLSADPNVNSLIERGQLRVLCLRPGKATDEWKSGTSTYNNRWIVGACENVADNYDMRNPPVFYYLKPNLRILSKTLQIDNLLEAFRIAYLELKKNEEEQIIEYLVVPDDDLFENPDNVTIPTE